MFEQERIDGEEFLVKGNHHIHQKWMDFRRIRNKWIYGLYGRVDNRISWTENGIPFWDYPPRISQSTGEIDYDDQELITQQINNPSWAKWYRSRNGSVEWGYVKDAWEKPHVEGKSSRVSMKLKRHWWNQAYEYRYALEDVE